MKPKHSTRRWAVTQSPLRFYLFQVRVVWGP